MDLLTERNEQMQLLQRIQQAMAEMEQQFAELQVRKERIIGAIQLIDKLLNVNSENSETTAQHPDTPSDV